MDEALNASLALSCLPTADGALGLRAQQWQRLLARLGVTVPRWVVHDLGAMALLDPAAVTVGADPASAAWANTVLAVGGTALMTRLRTRRTSDNLITLVLHRALSVVALPRAGASDEAVRAALIEAALAMELTLERIDPDTLTLLAAFEREGEADPYALAGWCQLLGSVEANDIVNFSMDLLPSVLETKRRAGQQTFAASGYAGIGTRGSVDALFLSELAMDEDVFLHRFVENELFYFTREKALEEVGSLHLIAIDASASMRGDRATFARGLAIALAKKLVLEGSEVHLRFFDSELYEPEVLHGRAERSHFNVAHLLGFRGERGRNYRAVFLALAREAKRLKARLGAPPVVHLLTHGESHAPLDAVRALVAEARVRGVYLMPSLGELSLEYLPLLEHHEVVDAASLGDRSARGARAKAILGTARPTAESSAGPAAGVAAEGTER